jgi:hypothetical protein
MSAGKRLDFLRNQFSKIDNDTFEKIVSFDPTPEKKYSSWLLKLHSKSGLNLNDLPTLKEVIKMHSSLKDKIPAEFRDINKFDSVVSFLFSMNVWFTNRFVENENLLKHLRNGGDILFENDDISIIRVLNHDGSVNYGSGTKWCTLKSDTYASYSQSGNLYIITPKSDKYVKYFGKKSQLHFEKEEFRNHDNVAIDLITIVCKHTELYGYIKLIPSVKASKVYSFFYIDECEDEDRDGLIKQYGFEILNFIPNFSIELTTSLFRQYGEKVFKHIPNSESKTISFICTIEGGLKKILVKGEEEVTADMFEKSVSVFPENILLMDCDNEELWKEVVCKEQWLINKSPFIKDTNKLVEIVLESFLVLKHISPLKVFSIEQRKKIAQGLIDDVCDNYLELLSCLGEFDESFQVSLVKKTPECVKFLVLPSEKAIKISERLIKEAEEKRQRKLEKIRKHSSNNGWGKEENWDYVLDEYNRTGNWNIGRLIQIIDGSGDIHYRDRDGHMYNSVSDYKRYFDAINSYDNPYTNDREDDDGKYTF